ncbi:hypothetical protein [Gimesia maris]|uniref:hypothetical protein n=1 Tax=Gimesia maris TaxID=122 RepID=UPI00241D91EF|nr:hypothetical protein [Gimesia maris]|tara:strand:- start:361316 stop:361831 length:516 start_codon:yes stop_codon:yes gene_type:complete
MNDDEAFEQLQIAVQNQQHGPGKIAKLAQDGFDLNYSPLPQHPVFLAIAFHHFNIVNALIDHGLRFDHRDPQHQNASLIQRLRSQRDFFEGFVNSPDHKESRSIIKRRLQGTLQAIEKYDRLVAAGTIAPIEDAPEQTGAELADQLEEKLKDIPGMQEAMQALLNNLRNES